MTASGTTVGIIGTGLIGASVGLRARELGRHVLGYDVDNDAASQAMQLGAIDESVTRDRIYQRATIVVFAGHVNATLHELHSIDRDAQPHAALMLDVASVKAPIVDAARGLRTFVASHPMAGSERSGPAAANARLFAGKPWLYVRSGDAEVDMRAVDFIEALGAVAVAVDAQMHDATVALTSHLPQAFAFLFAARLNERRAGHDITPYCGPTANELLRLSRSSVPMWRDILQTNGKNVAAEMRALARDLQEAADALDRGECFF